MHRIDLMLTNSTIREYRPMNWHRRRSYSRQIDNALRYVCPPDQTFKAVLELLFWLTVAGLVVACAVGFVVMFARWWMCA